MQWYESEVRALERADKSRTREGHAPVFYGSSSIRLWSTISEDFDPRVINLGFGGSTLEACDYFFARLVPPANPCSLLVYAGDNDLGDGRSVDQVLGWFRSLAKKVDASLGAVPFGFLSVKPSPARYPIVDRIRRFNEEVQREIESRASTYYVDVYSSMVDDTGKPLVEYFLADGLHLSRKGYRLWSTLLEPHRHRIFNE